MATNRESKIQILFSSATGATPDVGVLDYGELALNITDEKLYFKGNDDALKSVSAYIHVTGGVPLSPNKNDFWFETDTGSFYAYIDEGAGFNWVEVSADPAIAVTSVNGQTGDVLIYAGAGLTFAGGSTLSVDSTAHLYVAGISSNGSITAATEVRSQYFYGLNDDTGIDLDTTAQFHLKAGNQGVAIGNTSRLAVSKELRTDAIVHTKQGISMDGGGITFPDGTYQETAATSITDYVSSFNGSTGAIEGVSSVDGQTGDVRVPIGFRYTIVAGNPPVSGTGITLTHVGGGTGSQYVKFGATSADNDYLGNIFQIMSKGTFGSEYRGGMVTVTRPDTGETLVFAPYDIDLGWYDQGTAFQAGPDFAIDDRAISLTGKHIIDFMNGLNVGDDVYVNLHPNALLGNVTSVNGLTGAVQMVSSVNGQTGDIYAGGQIRYVYSSSGPPTSGEYAGFAPAGEAGFSLHTTTADGEDISNILSDLYTNAGFDLIVRSSDGTEIAYYKNVRPHSTGSGYYNFVFVQGASTTPNPWGGSPIFIQGGSFTNGDSVFIDILRYPNRVVKTFNGQTGDVQGVSSVNGATGDVEGVSSVNGATGAVEGVSSFNGLTGTVDTSSLTLHVAGISSDGGATFGDIVTVTESIKIADAGSAVVSTINQNGSAMQFYPVVGLVLSMNGDGLYTFGRNYTTTYTEAGSYLKAGSYLHVGTGISMDAGGITFPDGTYQSTAATSITDYVASFNGATGAVEGVSSVNGQTGGVTAGYIHVTAGTPVSATENDFWFETDTGSFYAYVDEGTGLNWVEVSADPAIAVTSFNGSTGDVQGVSTVNGQTGGVTAGGAGIRFTFESSVPSIGSGEICITSAILGISDTTANGLDMSAALQDFYDAGGGSILVSDSSGDSVLYVSNIPASSITDQTTYWRFTLGDYDLVNDEANMVQGEDLYLSLIPFSPSSAVKHVAGFLYDGRGSAVSPGTKTSVVRPVEGNATVNYFGIRSSGAVSSGVTGHVYVVPESYINSAGASFETDGITIGSIGLATSEIGKTGGSVDVSGITLGDLLFCGLEGSGWTGSVQLFVHYEV